MKLFLLGGFRGIVADLLWLRAEEHKKDHDWDRLETTVELITKLQPHFLSIWTFQGWNLAYNVSVEWDAPEDKYTWIKQGIKFVQEGVKKNRRSPDLIWDTAWFYYHKLGFSDESIILRRLFRDDEDEGFKTYDDPESGQPVVGNDNFKLGYGWFSRAVKLVDCGANRLNSGHGERYPSMSTRRPSARGGPTTSRSARCRPTPRPRYAAGLEKMSIYGIEATFGEVAKNEWDDALERMGQIRRSRLHVAQRSIRATASWCATRSSSTTSCNPERLQADARKPAVLDPALVRPDELPLLERAVPGRSDDQRRAGARSSSTTATRAYKTGDFPTAAEQVQGRARALEDRHERLSRLSRRRSEQERHRPDRQAVRPWRSSSFRCPVPDDLPFKDYLPLVQNDNTVDPFDAIEMIGVVSPMPARRLAAVRDRRPSHPGRN